MRGEANRALRFFNFVKAELGRCDLSPVDQPLVDRFARSLRTAGLRPVAAADLLRVIFDLHELRRHLPTARLSFEPWPERNTYSVACLLYTSDAADERSSVDLGGRRIIKKKKKSEK